MRRFGFDYEPVVSEVLQAGVDVVTFSGDKLLGGPQAGIIVGRETLLKKIKRNHLLRALRCDKVTLALLRLILQHYLDPDTVDQSNATLRLFARQPKQLHKFAEDLHHSLKPDIQKYFNIVEAEGRVGSGAYPVFPIPSYAISYTPGPVTADRLARKLRMLETPVFGYLENDKYLLNMLTLGDDEVRSIAGFLNDLL
jgi:L-seryl-tRNA(Ser) seleniumtransferase